MKRFAILLALVVCVAVTLGLTVASPGGVSAAPKEKSPLVGQWEAIDIFDGSHMVMTITGTPSGVELVDDWASLCPEGGPATLVGKVTSSDPVTIEVDYHVRCHIGDYDLGEGSVSFTYHPDGDLLTDSWGNVWTRMLVQAQPVARIALPEPGEAKDLFAGCNLISLTFPDGTTSEEVINAVTPLEAVETLWRQTPALDRFEGFAPAFPQASDLLAVHPLDPVWICISKTQGPLPTPVVGTPTSVVGTPTPEQTPAPTSGQLADVAITGMHLQRPEGRVWIWLQNKGPNSLVNATAQLQCNLKSIAPFDDNLVAGGGFQGPISFTLTVGQVADLPTAMTIDVSKALYAPSCEITNESFTDPTLSNNTKVQWFGPEADLALTDLFTSSLPVGDVYTRITNNGPDSLVNAMVHLNCSYTLTPQGGAPQTKVNPVVDVRVSLVPGQTEVFGTQISVNTFLGKYDVKCELTTSLDPKQGNNTYSLTIPAQTIE